MDDAQTPATKPADFQDTLVDLVADLDRQLGLGPAATEDPVLKRRTAQILAEIERLEPGAIERMRDGLAMLSRANVSVAEALGAVQ